MAPSGAFCALLVFLFAILLVRSEASTALADSTCTSADDVFNRFLSEGLDMDSPAFVQLSDGCSVLERNYVCSPIQQSLVLEGAPGGNSTWDTEFDLYQFSVTIGRTVTIRNLVLRRALVFTVGYSNIQPSIFHLRAGSRLLLQNVTVQTLCSTVLYYATNLEPSVWDLVSRPQPGPSGSQPVEQALFIRSLSTANVTLQNVTLTCDPGVALPSEAELYVHTAPMLTSFIAAANSLTMRSAIRLVENLTLPAVGPYNPDDPDPAIPVITSATTLEASNDTTITYVDANYTAGWVYIQPPARLTLRGLVLTRLRQDIWSPGVMNGVLAGAVALTMVQPRSSDSGQPQTPWRIFSNLTLALPRWEVTQMSYWCVMVDLMAPELTRVADFLRPLVWQSDCDVLGPDQVLFRRVRTTASSYEAVLLSSSPPPGVPFDADLQPPPGALAFPHVMPPLRLVSTPAELVDAMAPLLPQDTWSSPPPEAAAAAAASAASTDAAAGQLPLLLLVNGSVQLLPSDVRTPGGGQRAVRRSLIITSMRRGCDGSAEGGCAPAVVDLGSVIDGMRLDGQNTTVVFEGVTLRNATVVLAGRSGEAQPIRGFFSFNRSETRIVWESVTVELLAADFLDLYRSLASTPRGIIPGTTEVYRVNTTLIQLAGFEYAGIRGSWVNFTMIPGESLSNPGTLVVAAGRSGGGSSSGPTIAGACVGGAAVLVSLLSFAFFAHRRRRRRRGTSDPRKLAGGSSASRRTTDLEDGGDVFTDGPGGAGAACSDAGGLGIGLAGAAELKRPPPHGDLTDEESVQGTATTQSAVHSGDVGVPRLTSPLPAAPFPVPGVLSGRALRPAGVKLTGAAVAAAAAAERGSVEEMSPSSSTVETTTRGSHGSGSTATMHASSGRRNLPRPCRLEELTPPAAGEELSALVLSGEGHAAAAAGAVGLAPAGPASGDEAGNAALTPSCGRPQAPLSASKLGGGSGGAELANRRSRTQIRSALVDRQASMQSGRRSPASSAMPSFTRLPAPQPVAIEPASSELGGTGGGGGACSAPPSQVIASGTCAVSGGSPRMRRDCSLQSCQSCSARYVGPAPPPGAGAGPAHSCQLWATGTDGTCEPQSHAFCDPDSSSPPTSLSLAKAPEPASEVARLISELSAQGTDQLVILEPIGQGGYGTVYRGVWRNLDVAVKTVLFQDRANLTPAPSPAPGTASPSLPPPARRAPAGLDDADRPASAGSALHVSLGHLIAAGGSRASTDSAPDCLCSAAEGGGAVGAGTAAAGCQARAGSGPAARGCAASGARPRSPLAPAGGVAAATHSGSLPTVHVAGGGAGAGPFGVASQQRAVLEAAVSCSVAHPNVVATYHYDITPVRPSNFVCSGGLQISDAQQRGLGGGGPGGAGGAAVIDWKLYLVQEFCDAGSLANALDRRAFHDPAGMPNLALTLCVLTDVARGMAHIHSRSIVHGDLNPTNILLRSFGGGGSGGGFVPLRNQAAAGGGSGCATPVGASATAAGAAAMLRQELGVGLVAKVADFGLCGMLAPGKRHISNAQRGTPFYTSPETVETGTLTKASDVYSFGVIVWEVYMGRPPFQHDPQRGFVRHELFPRLPPHVPPTLATMTQACLSADPDSRPTFDQILERLTALQSKLASGLQQRLSRLLANGGPMLGMQMAGAPSPPQLYGQGLASPPFSVIAAATPAMGVPGGGTFGSGTYGSGIGAGGGGGGTGGGIQPPLHGSAYGSGGSAAAFAALASPGGGLAADGSGFGASSGTVGMLMAANGFFGPLPHGPPPAVPPVAAGATGR